MHEGVPSWLRRSLLDWVIGQITDSRHYVDPEDVKWLERRLRLELDWGRAGPDQLVHMIENDDELLLDVVDALLGRTKWRADNNLNSEAVRLLMMMHDAGSAWGIQETETGHLRLMRRVGESAVADAKQAMEGGTRASHHLRRAWNAAFGRNPNASEAYREAVKAVEASARPVVIPTDPVATLGKVIAAMRDAPQKWQVVLDSARGFDQVGAVIQMCDSLWQGQVDRHGTDEANAPLNVTDKQAEAAVHLAVLLVQWFETGVISRI